MKSGRIAAMERGEAGHISKSGKLPAQSHSYSNRTAETDSRPSSFKPRKESLYQEITGRLKALGYF